MKDKCFPAIIMKKKEPNWEGVFGLKLLSVLSADIATFVSVLSGKKEEVYSNSIPPETFQKARESFLYTMSACLQKITMELHWTILPNLEFQARGLLWVSLFFRTCSSDDNEVKRRLIEAYLISRPLLSAFFPGIELVPIVDQNELWQRYQPFEPKHAIFLSRRASIFSLSTPLKVKNIGFGKVSEESYIPERNEVTHIYPWIPSVDDQETLTQIMIGQLDPIKLIIRIRLANAQGMDIKIERLKNNIQTCELFMAGVNTYQITLEQQAKILRDISLRTLSLTDGPSFNIGVFAISSCSINQSIPNVIGKLITGSALANDLSAIFQGGVEYNKIPVNETSAINSFSEKEPFALEEAACSLVMPNPPKQLNSVLPVKRSRSSLAALPDAMREGFDSIKLFLNVHHGINQTVDINSDDRMRHMFVAGQTGTGKSTFMENMIIQDIQADRGVAVLDPHGDLCDSIIAKIPERRKKDVIIFDVLDRDYPIGYNILEFSTIDERDLIIDELYQTLDHLYSMQSVGGPMFENNFRNMLALLCGEKKRKDFIPTLLDFTRCYTDHDFRHSLLKNIDDRQIIDFIEQLENTGGEASLQNLSPYITSKFSRFTSDRTLRRIIGQDKTCFDFDQIMNQSKIFLVKLGRGRFGSTISSLIANQLVARFKMAAMKRGDIPQDKRRDFFLYIDEAHCLPPENFMDLLAEARKFRMGLILSTQYTAQLKKSTQNGNSLLSAVLGNVGSIIMFRLGQEDALSIAQTLYPYYSMQDIIGLPNWNGYARLSSSSGTVPPFSFSTIKDKTPISIKSARRIIQHSRKVYGQTADKVDAAIANRLKRWATD